MVRDTLANNYIRPHEATKAQSKVKQKGRFTFIDKAKVRLTGSTYVAECVNFGSSNLRISDADMHAYGRWAPLNTARHPSATPSMKLAKKTSSVLLQSQWHRWPLPAGSLLGRWQRKTEACRWHQWPDERVNTTLFCLPAGQQKRFFN